MKKIRYLIFFYLISITSIYAENIVFSASAPTVVSNQSQFQLVYSVNEVGKNIELGEIEDFDVIFGPQSFIKKSSSNINGQVQNSISNSYTYILQAKKEGSFTIPPATIIVDGQKYTSNSINIKVIPARENNTSASQDNNQKSTSGIINVNGVDVFIKAIVSDTEVYEQEPILLSFKLYVRGVNFSNFSEMKYPDNKGFIAQDIELPRDREWNLENYHGNNYNTILLKQTLLFPQKSGKLKIESGIFEAILRMQINSRRSIFDSFLGGYQDVKKTLKTEPINIYVKSLPHNKPSNFSNAVGSFSLKSELSSNNVKENEPITLKFAISGTGNLRLIKNPEIKFPADFEVYDPKTETNLKTTSNGVSGTKNIEYLIIPRQFGKFKIPAVEFSYFDFKSKSYKTIKTEDYHITVEKGDGRSSNSNTGNTYINKESLKYLGKDIQYIETQNTKLKKKKDFFYGSFLFWVSYIIPLLLSVFAFIFFRKQAKQNADIAFVRNKKANKLATKKLKLAHKYLKLGNKEKFYDEISKALWGYLSDKLNISLAKLTKEEIESELKNKDIEDNIIAEIKHILSVCEYARYAPSEGTVEMTNIYNQTNEKISMLEELIKK